MLMQRKDAALSGLRMLSFAAPGLTPLGCACFGPSGLLQRMS